MTTPTGQMGSGSGLVTPPKGFQLLTGEMSAPRRKLVVNLGGHEKSGKTDWPLRTAPEPVFHYVLDPNGESVAQKIVRETGRKIYIGKYILSRGQSQVEYQYTWAGFKESVRSAMEQPAGTLVIDTGTEAYEMIRLAAFGKTSQVMPVQYGPVNEELKSLLREMYDSSLNVFFIHKMRKEYVNDKPTGNFEFAQWSDMPFQVQVNMEAWADEKAFAGWNGKVGQKNADGTPHPWPFHVYIRNCNQNMTLNGKDFTTDFFTYPVMLNLVFGA